MERKLATLLFADLVGSTALGESSMRSRRETSWISFYEAMEAEIALGGGTVEKFIGDAVVAVFGAPAAQDATPSVHCKWGCGLRAPAGKLSATGSRCGSA